MQFNILEMRYEPNILILCGPPGCGKSSYIRKTIPKLWAVVSRDQIRFELYGINYKQNSFGERRVTEQFKIELNAHLMNRRDIVIDNTNCKPERLQEYINIGLHHGYWPIVKFFDTPLWLCRWRVFKRHLLGGHDVPRKIIKTMKNNYDNINKYQFKAFIR